jgi:hypothetical protein
MVFHLTPQDVFCTKLNDLFLLLQLARDDFLSQHLCRPLLDPCKVLELQLRQLNLLALVALTGFSLLL